jgi:hypothetical protein
MAEAVDLLEIVNSLNDINDLSCKILMQESESKAQLREIYEHFKILFPLTEKKKVFCYDSGFDRLVCITRKGIYLLASPNQVPNTRVTGKDLVVLLKRHKHDFLNAVEYHKDLVEEFVEHVSKYEFLEEVVVSKFVDSPARAVEFSYTLNGLYILTLDEASAIFARADEHAVEVSYGSKSVKRYIDLPVRTNVEAALTAYSLRDWIVPLLEDLYAEREETLKRNEQIVEKVKEVVAPVLVEKKLEQS